MFIIEFYTQQGNGIYDVTIENYICSVWGAVGGVHLCGAVGGCGRGGAVGVGSVGICDICGGGNNLLFVKCLDDKTALV